MEFQTAKMDRTTMFFTLLFSAICIGVIFLLLFVKKEGENRNVIWFPIIIVSAALISSYLMIPKIFLESRAIRIKNSFVNFEIPFSEIKSIEKFTKKKINLRTFGVGGLFGYFGYFNGNDVWYVTNMKKKIKITMTSGKIYMLSPENLDDFVQRIQPEIPSS